MEIIELAQGPRTRAGVSICGVKAFVVLNIHKYIVLAGFREEVLMFGEVLDRGFRDKDVDAAAYGVESDGVVCCVGCKDRDGVAG